MSVAKDHLYMIGKELEDESTTLQYFWGVCWLPRSIPHQTRPLTRVPVFFTWPRSIRLPQELIKDPFSTEPWLLMYLGLFWMCCHCTGLFVLSLCHLQHLNHLHSTVNYEKVFTTTTLKIIFVLAGSWGFLILGYNICTNPCLMCCDKNNLQPLTGPYIIKEVKFYPMQTWALGALKCFQTSFSTCEAIHFEPLYTGPNSWQPVIGSCEILCWIGTNGTQSHSFILW